ncbi:FAD-binding domain-containing protein [Massarina eburnea CBS 473.64]|uniref:FAD-binding domain-containing protein n=1 Tax=Massarina eburnea CBS 473.64 TaxID=1395130 RepID=A0A6A6SBH7_9PLEO|nr:FAD-binding domain-containing protein [Massarina eburnea CBS 473.64]
MRCNILFSAPLTLLLASTAASQNDTNSCKCVPSDPCWPTPSDFAALNDTLSGRLIEGIPPASVCYTSHPNYDAIACDAVLANWFVSDFHASDPISIGWPWWANNPCPPIYPNGTSVTGDTRAGEKGCGVGRYPVYAVNATEEVHVIAAVRFAAERGIRLNVKNTGHSFLGRSTAFGSLSVWTHHLKGIQYQESFRPESCPSNETYTAFTLGAGERDREVYEAAHERNIAVVGGSNQNVGIVGWFSGGGHGPLSSTYGLGVDNVLQVKIVTPDGVFRTVNSCQEPDLFWALRGGGGGTFGVITEVTMKAHPDPQTTLHTFSMSLINLNNLTGFWDLVAYIISETPRLKAAGMQGYGGFEFSDHSFSWQYNVHDKPNGTVEELFAPIAAKLDPEQGKTISYFTKVTHYPNSFASWNDTIGFESVAAGAPVLGSRLLPASALTNDTARLARVLQNITSSIEGLTSFRQLQLHLIANNNTEMIKETSVTPAWRDAVLHFIIIEGHSDADTYEASQPIINDMTKEKVAQLKALAPDSGAYLNECDPFDEDWQNDFWGEHYPRLRELKMQYDPDSLLWCISCVGSEDWAVEESSGRLCQVSPAN